MKHGMTALSTKAGISFGFHLPSSPQKIFKLLFADYFYFKEKKFFFLEVLRQEKMKNEDWKKINNTQINLLWYSKDIWGINNVGKVEGFQLNDFLNLSNISFHLPYGNGSANNTILTSRFVYQKIR